MKLNNKGFLITGILYSLLLLFLVLIIGMISIVSARQTKLNYIEKNIITKLNDKYELNVVKTWNFDYTGDYQTFVVPTDGYYKVELWGASGDDISKCTWSGCTKSNEKISNGAYSSGLIYLNKNTTLYIYVGEKGTSGTNINNYSIFNGGGSVSGAYNDGNNYTGGGASDVRLVNGNWDNFNSLKSRIIVAGGGGGVVYPVVVEGHAGTYSSNIAKGPVNTIANAATQNSGYKFGTGQTGLRAGGGGGYYGGYASNYTASGGSSFVSGLQGCDAIAESSTEDNIIHTAQPNHYSGKVFSNAIMIAGNVEMPTHDGTDTMTGNTGNGYAKISLLKEPVNTDITEFNYTGNVQTFTAPETGTYKLETWGAQGGSVSDSLIGGYGGYSTGLINLNKGDKLYVYIGGKGSTDDDKTPSTYVDGGYNGGGNACGYKDKITSSGGGATHIATVSGLLKNLENYKDTAGDNISNEILIVAGGGGGAGYQNSSYWLGSGGSGGGQKGSAGSYVDNYQNLYVDNGATQTSGGTFIQYGSYTYYSSSFGMGGGAAEDRGNASGGGGGYYGGGVGNLFMGAGGGSGYIGSSLLTNKHMTCYNCTTDNHDNTMTISNLCHSDVPVSDCSKEGNGYVKITYID